MSTDSRKQVRRSLACEFHGSRDAAAVCGECGTPLCPDCSSTVPDVTLDHYVDGGFRRLVFGLALVVGVPLLLQVVAPRLLITVTSAVADSPLYLKGGLVQGSILVGLGLLSAVRFRSVDNSFELLVGRANQRTVCDGCKPEKNLQRFVRYGVVAVAAGLVLLGLALSVPNGNFNPVRISGAGLALFVARDQLVSLAARILES